MGRPPKWTSIDPREVENYAMLGCSDRAIATLLDVDHRTIERHFSPQLEKGRERGNTLLRKWQWDAAQKGNTTMLIWLGKQRLGQTDKMDNRNFEDLNIEVILPKEMEPLPLDNVSRTPLLK